MKLKNWIVVALLVALVSLMIVPVMATDYLQTATYYIHGVGETTSVNQFGLNTLNTTFSASKTILGFSVTGYGFHGTNGDWTDSGILDGAADGSGANYGCWTAHLVTSGTAGAWHQPYSLDVTFNPPQTSMPSTSFLYNLGSRTTMYVDRDENSAADTNYITQHPNEFPFPMIVMGRAGWIGNGSYTIRFYNTTTNVTTINPVSNFTCTPLTQALIGSTAPITCTDQSTGDGINGWNWTVTSRSSGSSLTSNSQNPTFYLPEIAVYNVSLKVSNPTVNSTLTKANYVSVTNPGSVSLLVDIRNQINPDMLITSASFGIQNLTSGAWGNTTANTGAIEVSDILGVPLGLNQNVRVCAGATGYSPACNNVTIAYDGYESTILLTPTTQTLTGGNWNLAVKVKRNLDGQPIPGASVEVQTGVSGPGTYSGGTNDQGIASFQNISASTSALVSVVKQGYSSGSAVVTVFPNTSQTVTIELIGIGQTPVSTPIAPTPTRTLSGSGTVAPVITDASGNVITTSEGKASWGLDQLFGIIPWLAVTVVSFIVAWMFWRGMDIMTNGMTTYVMRKTIDWFFRR